MCVRVCVHAYVAVWGNSPPAVWLSIRLSQTILQLLIHIHISQKWNEHVCNKMNFYVDKLKQQQQRHSYCYCFCYTLLMDYKYINTSFSTHKKRVEQINNMHQERLWGKTKFFLFPQCFVLTVLHCLFTMGINKRHMFEHAELTG